MLNANPNATIVHRDIVQTLAKLQSYIRKWLCARASCVSAAQINTATLLVKKQQQQNNLRTHSSIIHQRSCSKHTMPRAKTTGGSKLYIIIKGLHVLLPLPHHTFDLSQTKSSKYQNNDNLECPIRWNSHSPIKLISKSCVSKE
jgi:hypothetical protein